MAFESLTIDLNARLAKFETELRKVGTSVERHAKNTQRAYQQAFDGLEAGARRLAGLLGATLTIGGLVALTRDSIGAIAALDDLSERTGLTVELLSQLQEVATIGGHSLDDVAGLASKFAKNVALAAGGNKELVKTFEDLGISQQQLKNQSFDETFLQFARAIATAENQTNAIARAQILAGKAAAQSIPFFRDLAEEGLKTARVTTEQAAAAERFEKNIKRLSNAVDGLKIAFANDLVEQLNRVAEAMQKAAKSGGVLSAIWEGLIESMSQSFGSLNANDLGRVTTQIQGAERALKSLQEQAAASSRPEAFSGAIARAQEQLAILAADRTRLQALVDIETPGRVFQSATAAPPKTGGEPTGIGTAADVKGLEDALARLAESRAKRIAESEQRLATLRLKTLEGFYGQGLIAEGEYWDTRQAIQADALAGELAAIDSEVTVRRQALAGAKSGTADYANATRELEEALARRNKAEQDFGAFAVENSLQAARAARAYADAVAELDAKLLDAEGRSAAALAIRQEQQSRALRARLEANGDAAGLGRLDAVERAGRAQATVNDLRTRGAEITDRLAIAEERIQNSLRTGAISELEALRRTGIARQGSVEQLGEIADALDQAAAASGLERLRIQAEQFRVELERLAGESDLLKQKFDTIGEGAFSTFLEDTITGTKSVSDAFRAMADDIVRQISRIAAQDIAKKIFGGAEDKGLGFGSILAKIFGGASGGGSIVDAFSAGNFATGGSFLVGGSGGIDQTPVMFRATAGERVTVTPPGQSAGGGMSVVQNFHIVGQADRRTQANVMASAAAGLSNARRRNG